MKKNEGNRYGAKGLVNENFVDRLRKKQKYLTHHNNFLRNTGFLKSNISFGEAV